MPGVPNTYQFNLAATDYAICTASPILTASAYTVLLWVYPTALTAGRWLWAQNNIGNGRVRIFRMDGADGSKLSAFITSTDVPAAREVISVTGTLKVGLWQCLAVTYDDAAAVRQCRIYVGTDTSPVAEVTYGSTLAVAGTITVPTGTFNIANRIGGTDSLAFPGYIGPLVVIQGSALGVVELNQIAENITQAKQYQPTLLTYLGKYGTGKFVDESGHNNHGTIGGGAPASFGIPRIRPTRAA